MDGLEDSLHVQHLKKIAALLKEAQQQSDSVTWVPETIPQYVQNAVRRALEATDNDAAASPQQPSSPAPACLPGYQQQSYPTAAPSEHGLFDFDDDNPRAMSFTASQAALQLGSLKDAARTADQHARAEDIPEADGPVVIIGSHCIRAKAANNSSSSWVVTACLVPDGLPTAAAADVGGGLACLEVVCRVLSLQDGAPAAATPGITKALSKVKWQEFGLSFKGFAPSTADTTGILTLDVMPHAVVTPLAMVVCSINTICTCSDPILAAAAAASIAPTEATARDSIETTSTPAATSSSRKHTSNRNNKPPTLSCKRETAACIAAFQDALLALKARLPAGYLQGKLEACVASCLPPISSSLTSILTHAANPVLCQQACELLSCETEQLQQTLLLKLQTAASTALAAKSSVGSSARQLESQRRQIDAGASKRSKTTAVAAAVAALAATAGDGMGGNSSSIEMGSNAGQQEPRPSQSWQQQRWQAGSQNTAPFIDVRDGCLQDQRQQDQSLHAQESATQDFDGEQQPDWLCIEPALPTPVAVTAGQLDWPGNAGFSTGADTAHSQGFNLWQSMAANDGGWLGRPRRQPPDNMLSQPALQQQLERQLQQPQSTGSTPANGLCMQRPVWQHPEELTGAEAPRYHCDVTADADAVLRQPATGAACALFSSLLPDYRLPVCSPGGSSCANLGPVPDAPAAAEAARSGWNTGNLIPSQAGWHVRHPARPPRRRVSGSAAASLF